MKRHQNKLLLKQMLLKWRFWLLKAKSINSIQGPWSPPQTNGFTVSNPPPPPLSPDSAAVWIMYNPAQEIGRGVSRWCVCVCVYWSEKSCQNVWDELTFISLSMPLTSLGILHIPRFQPTGRNKKELLFPECDARVIEQLFLCLPALPPSAYFRCHTAFDLRSSQAQTYRIVCVYVCVCVCARRVDSRIWTRKNNLQSIKET